ncbi:MAG: (d)CMP kinase [Clostridia bacterium]|nr:(d)CMP kinase [Clostridia bacterium]
MANQITIDGFNGTGKSTLAKNMAKELNYTYVSTGVVYRCLSYVMMENGIQGKDIEGICRLFESMQLTLPNNDNPDVILNGKVVTKEIKDMKYAILSKEYSDNPLIQEPIRQFIRKFTENCNVIVDGRDSGRLLFPNAMLKIALTASLDVRAKRRQAENKDPSVSLEDVKKQITKIDNELIAENCIPPEDAKVIDTSHISQQEVLAKALHLFRNCQPAKSKETN